MKNLKVVVSAFLILVSTTISTAALAADDPKTTSEEIASLLKNPGFDVEHDITAFVTFIINKNSEIVILSIDSEDENMKRFIKGRLNYQKVGSSEEKGKEYKVPVRMTSEN